MPLYTLLTASDWTEYVPIVGAVVCGVIVLIAFCVGLKKGARRVSWGGLVWAVAACAFFLVHAFVLVQNDPLKAVMTPVAEMLLATAGASTAAAAKVGAFLSAFTWALGCAAVALILCGVCTLLFRPKTKLVKMHSDEIDEEGAEYDDEYEEYDDYEQFESRKAVRRSGYGTPSLLGRLLGGLICAVNTAMVLAVVIAATVFLIDCTSLKGVFAGLYNQQLMNDLVWLTANYALDLAMIGIVIAFVFKGQKEGFVHSIASLIGSFGMLIAVGVAFYLPFSGLPIPFLTEFVDRCVSLSVTAFSGTLADFAPIIGQIMAGAIFCLVFVLLILLIKWLFKKLEETVEDIAVLRIIDGVLAAVLFAVIGIVVIALIWAVWYALSHYGLFNAEVLFTDNSTLSAGMYTTMKEILSPMLSGLADMIKGMLAF